MHWQATCRCGGRKRRRQLQIPLRCLCDLRTQSIGKIGDRRRYAVMMRLAIVAIVLTGCGTVNSTQVDAGPGSDTGGGSDTGTGTDTPPDTGGSTFGQAYVGNFNNGSGGNIGVYTSLPLTASSTPAFTLGSANGLSAPIAIRVAPNNTQIWVADAGSSKILAFDLPLTASSQAAVTLTAANEPFDLQFDNHGNLWVGEFTGKIEEWTVGNLSGPSAKTLATGTGANIFAIAFDAVGNLYTGGPGSPFLHVFTNPATASAPSVSNATYAGTISGLAVSGGKLFVGSFATGVLGFYTLPITATSQPTTLISSGVFGQKLGFAPTGELTVPVGESGAQNKVNFYTAPGFTTLAFSLANLNDPRALTFSP